VGEIQADIVAEAKRLLELAGSDDVPLRVLGGVAIHLRAPGELPASLTRKYGDVDFVTAKGASAAVQSLLRGNGYEPHVAFNALHGTERLLFFDNGNERQVDVFVGTFAMSHKVPVADRLDLEPATLPLAELLVTKLQIAELNEKDVRDTLSLLLDHPVGEEDGDMLNAAQVARLCADDWGLWRTTTMNLDKVRQLAQGYRQLTVDQKAKVESQVAMALARLESEPKPLAWRLRARVGDRVKWYKDVDEVQ
jgi:hypothetical protein